ncbi:hypothetical protein, partial [Craurococcus roseus]|uniref:hypothetical protein n=1 Tax=Craurococcus roseus TaxID=77585 RepID=UPI0031CE27B9
MQPIDRPAREGDKMVTKTAGAHFGREVITLADRRMAVWTVGIIFVTLMVWTVAAVERGSPFRYVLYLLPPLLALAYCLNFNGAQIRVDHRGATAFTLYV